jgi:hypothetical protein
MQLIVLIKYFDSSIINNKKGPTSISRKQRGENTNSRLMATHKYMYNHLGRLRQSVRRDAPGLTRNTFLRLASQGPRGAPG